MALPKVCGIETEYGIMVRGAESQPGLGVVAADQRLRRAVSGRDAAASAGTSTTSTPGNDARGFSLDDVIAPEIETNLVNAVLTNGARYYVDHAHPEISDPGGHHGREAVRWDRAAEEIIRMSVDGRERPARARRRGARCRDRRLQEQLRRQGQQLRLPRELPVRPRDAVRPDRRADHAALRHPPGLLRRRARSAASCPGWPHDDVPFQLSQRADFFEEEVGLETTLKRPIVNTRDEPHCDAQKYRRLHVIVGDANMSEVATYLKVGTTAIVLAMIEDDVLGDDWLLGNPVPAIRQVSHDPTLRRTIMLSRRAPGHRARGPVGPARAGAASTSSTTGWRCVGEDVGPDVLERWERVLDGPGARSRRRSPHWVDWVAKRRLVDGYAERHGLEPGDARLKAIDLQYHDLRPDRCLARRAGLETIVDPGRRRCAAMTEPPTTTRAYFRGRCLAKYPDEIVAANWDSIVFDVGRDPLRRVPMMEPLRGTAEHVG